MVTIFNSTAIAITPQATINKTLNKIENACEYKIRVACKAPLGARNFKEGKLLEHPEYKKFKKQAVELAQVWADTILEGPYISISDTELIGLSEIYENGRLIAYRITFKEDAIDTDSCQGGENVNPEKDPTCERGYIAESVVFNPDLSTSGNLNRDEANFYTVE